MVFPCFCFSVFNLCYEYVIPLKPLKYNFQKLLAALFKYFSQHRI